MTVNTKGFVLTKCKDVFFVSERIERALNNLINPGWRAQVFSPRTEAEKANPQFERVQMRLLASSGAVQFVFTYQGENRTLWLNFYCDCDNVLYGPQSLSLSLGCWGVSELLMKTALEAVSMLGPVYFDQNDCDDIAPAVLDVVPPTYLSACAAGDEHSSFVTLQQWHRVCMRGEMRKGTFKDWLGMDVATVNEVLKADYPTSTKMLEQMVEKFKMDPDMRIPFEA